MQTISEKEIGLWVDNDEGLYNWFRSSRKTKRQFIRENKDELIEIIRNILEGKKRPHYLAY